MADDFKKFKKMYKEGGVKTLANPPPMPGLAGAARGLKSAYEGAKAMGTFEALGASSLGAGVAGAFETASNYYNKKKNKPASDKSRLNKGR